jgi:carbon storage regulator
MLILSRKLDESIVIGDNITVKILSIDKGSVKLGIDAPSDVSILREELKVAVTDANRKASKSVDINKLQQLLHPVKKGF